MGTNERGEERDSVPPSWPDERGTDAGVLPSHWPPRMTQAVISEACDPDWRGAALQDEPPLWERWYERALEEGVDEDLASLGRSLMCEARLQRWGEARAAECGWLDEGEAMLELAQLEPDRAHTR